MKPLAESAVYYSPYESDHKMYSGYKTSDQIKRLADMTYLELEQLYGGRENYQKNMQSLAL